MLSYYPRQTATIPSIFTGVDKIEYTPEGIEQAQATFNEKALYQAIATFAQEWYKKNQRVAKVLDLCSATGLCAWQVAQAIPVDEVTLVDIDRKYLEVGVKHFEEVSPVLCFCEDAVYFNKQQTYDLILMNSAYHHIENGKKVAFLKNARNLLANGGEILIGDNFLPKSSTGNRDEFRQSVVLFYTHLLKELQKRNEPSEAINVIRKAAFNCWQGIEEYKVSFPVFKNHAIQSNLSIQKVNQVWIAEENKQNYACGVWGSFAASICSI